MMRRWALAALALVAAASIAACGVDDGDGLTVFAASSLTGAFTEIGAAYEAQHPGVDVTFNFGGSPALRAQLEQGARAGVLATADPANMRAALANQLVVDGGATFARNRLVIIVPASNPAEIASAADLAEGGVKLALAQEGVPAGDYARDALGKMEADVSYGAGFRARVLDRVVSEEPNVKGVVTKVQLGEVDAGIVYATDVTPEVAEEVQTIAIPDAFNVLAAYPIAITADAENATVARAFIDFALSDEGQAILARHGFLAP